MGFPKPAGQYEQFVVDQFIKEGLTEHQVTEWYEAISKRVRDVIIESSRAIKGDAAKPAG